MWHRHIPNNEDKRASSAGVAAFWSSEKRLWTKSEKWNGDIHDQFIPRQIRNTEVSSELEKKFIE